MEEIWKDIPGYEGLYQVSNMGRVRSFKKWRTASGLPRILTNYKNEKGYLICRIGKKHMKVHRLVALAFVPNPQGKDQVNHIDGNKSNPVSSNLEWVTNGENQKHAIRTGLKSMKYLTDVTSKRVSQFTKLGEYIRTYKSIQEAARETGTQQSQITGCCNHKPHCLTANGYIWKFESEVM